MRHGVERRGPGRRRLRIAFVYDAAYPFLRGGAEKRYYEIARRLGRETEVHQITWQYWDGEAVTRMDNVVFHGVGRPRRLYGGDGKRTVSEPVAFAARIFPVLLRERFDVIDCSATPYVPLYSCWLASRLTRTPLVVTWHEFWGEYWLTYLRHRRLTAGLARRVETRAIPLCDAVVAVSQFTAERLRPSLPRDRPMQVVENGISFQDIQKVAAAGDGADVVFAGRLIDDKNLPVLLEAMALIRAQSPQVRCDIIGDGPEKNNLQRLADRLGLDGHVRFLGQLGERDLYATMKAARVFALPSIREGFGIAVVEAQACGLVPVVARAPLSAASSLVRHDLDGLVSAPDSKSFAAAILGLLQDERRCTAMSAAARQAASARDWDRIAEKMGEVYLPARARER